MTGLFDIDLTWSTDPAANSGANAPDAEETSGPMPSGPSVFTALQQYGLRLEPGKAAEDFIVVDHMERAATEN